MSNTCGSRTVLGAPEGIEAEMELQRVEAVGHRQRALDQISKVLLRDIGSLQ